MKNVDARQVSFLSQRREEPHNTRVQVAQTTDVMQWEMDEQGSFLWGRAIVLGVDFRIRLIDTKPIEFIRRYAESLSSIRRAMVLARTQGARDIGLGSLVASVAHGGKDILPDAEMYRLRLDHGDDMSTGFAAQAAYHLRELGLPLADLTVGIVGAVGIMGAGFARLLARDVKKLVLVVTANDDRVQRLALELKETASNSKMGNSLEIEIATDFHALKRHAASVVYVAHSAPTALLRPDHLNGSAVVLDACIPPAVSVDQFSPDRYLVLSVGCGVVPDRLFEQPLSVDLGLDRTKDGPIFYGCMIGCILAAHRGETEHRINPVDPVYSRMLLKEGEKRGITHQPFIRTDDEIVSFFKSCGW